MLGLQSLSMKIDTSYGIGLASCQFIDKNTSSKRYFFYSKFSIFYNFDGFGDD